MTTVKDLERMGCVSQAMVNGKAKYKRIFIQNLYPLPAPDDDPMTACWKLLRYGRFMAESAMKFPASQKRFLWDAVDKLRKAEEEWNKIGVLEILTDGTARETTMKESAAGDAAKDAEG